MTFCPNCGKEVQEDSAYCPSCGRNLKAQAPPQPTVAPAYSGGIDSDASTARTLTLVAIILQAFFFIIGLFSSFLLLSLKFFMATPFMMGFFPFMFGFGFLISIIWIALDYFLIYKNLFSPANVPSARTPALILGIIQLLFAGFIPGILLIIAYVKIGDSMHRRGQTY